ncbi:MAG TPA: VWA domain-containing protein [Thermoanaerobaculia bacterium]|nr:VWA domain-containing protein [Thermoanaerobaculia bacterium]
MKRNLLVLLSGLARPSILLLALVLLALGPANSQDRVKPPPPGTPMGQPKPNDDASSKVEAKDEAAETEEDGPFGETIFVRVVNIDVFVRDKDGNPVTGLTQDDFELYEDGKPITITNFYEYKEGKEVKEEEPVPEKRERPRSRDEVFESHPGLATSDVPEDQRLNLVVYVDQQNITPISRNKLFRYLRQFLNTKLDRDDRVMLVTYNRSLKVVRPFTTDSQLVADATYELEKHTGGRSTQNSDRIDVLKEIDEGRDCQMSFGRAKLYAENVFNDLQFTLDGLRLAMDQLAGVPGRKAVLYVSEGLQMRAGEDIFWAIDERYRDGDNTQAGVGGSDCSNAIMESFHYDASRRLTDIANVASANRVTIYTVDAAGLRIGGLRSAEFGSIGLSTNIESIYTRNLQDTLMFLADKTGGKSIVNTNNFLDGLSSIGADFDNFYSLGFQPSHAGTGRRYPLEVKIKKEVMRAHNIKDSNIRTRDSYRDKPLEQEMGDATLAALTFGFESNNHNLKLEVEDMIQGEKGDYTVHLKIMVPIDSLQLYPLGQSETWEARMRLWVQAIDGQGRTSPVQEQRWTLAPAIPTQDLETVKEKYTTYVIPMIMRRGDQRVAIALRDEISAKTSYVTKHVSVG